MVKCLLLLLFAATFAASDIRLEYLKEKPSDTSSMTLLEMRGLDSLEACESILVRIEKQLRKKAKDSQHSLVKIYIVEQVKPQIQTESQFGRIGSVSIMYSME
jgi:hypothetical protein